MAESIEILIKALGDLRRPPNGRHDLGEALRAVTAAAAATIAGVECADIVLIGKDTFESHGATSSLSRELGRIQRDAGGPCIDAAGLTSVVYSSDLRSEMRWPQFTEEALRVGVGSVLSFQLHTRTDIAGSLNLFASKPQAFDGAAVALGTALAAQAAAELTAARAELHLRSALGTRDTIGQAKGLLMQRCGVDAARAFVMMRTLSQDLNVAVARIAERIVEDHTASL
ncbi:ANTAR domain-containing protein [Rhodococcus sp. 5G237]